MDTNPEISAPFRRLGLVSMKGRIALTGGGPMERERRRTPRYIFIASAELYEEASDVRVASRVSELSLHGCYLDMMNPFPPGTIIRLKIFAGDLTFQSKARVIYSTSNVGAGVAFIDVEPKYEYMIKRWMEDAAKH
jgi:PilZ domain